jgi:hypothetical protein
MNIAEKKKNFKNLDVDTLKGKAVQQIHGYLDTVRLDHVPYYIIDVHSQSLSHVFFCESYYALV